MKKLLRLLPCFALALLASALIPTLRAAEDPKLVAAITAADAERLAATMAADASRLDAILSDDLRYAHSNGKVDTKASYMNSLVTKATVYENVEYLERHFVPAGSGAVLMNGRAIFKVRNGEQRQAIDLNFLAVWREENGKWRFLAWQSCRNQPPAPVNAPAAK